MPSTEVSEILKLTDEACNGKCRNNPWPVRPGLPSAAELDAVAAENSLSADGSDPVARVMSSTLEQLLREMRAHRAQIEHSEFLETLLWNLIAAAHLDGDVAKVDRAHMVELFWLCEGQQRQIRRLYSMLFEGAAPESNEGPNALRGMIESSTRLEEIATCAGLKINRKAAA